MQSQLGETKSKAKVLTSGADQALNPNLERFFAKRIGAKTIEIKSSHVPFISHPAEVARLIEQAAMAAEK